MNTGSSLQSQRIVLEAKASMLKSQAKLKSMKAGAKRPAGATAATGQSTHAQTAEHTDTHAKKKSKTLEQEQGSGQSDFELSIFFSEVEGAQQQLATTHASASDSSDIAAAAMAAVAAAELSAEKIRREEEEAAAGSDSDEEDTGASTMDSGSPLAAAADNSTTSSFNKGGHVSQRHKDEAMLDAAYSARIALLGRKRSKHQH
jgi:hypothetical protein